METDLAQCDTNPGVAVAPLRAEICIVGAGIAGLTLAHKLTQLGHDVLLLEAGGRTPDPASRVEEIVQHGEPHPGTTVEARVRALGGTSLTWGGQLLPLPADAAWPISSAELARYYSEAERLLGVDNLPYDSADFFRKLHQPAPAILQSLPQLEPLLSKFAPFSHRNLARTLGVSLRAQPRARILLYALAIELLLAPARDSIAGVLVRTPAGQTQRIEAVQYILAAGTVETVRILLASRSISPEGIGNQHDQVGRNFHDHLTVTAATIHAPARNRILSALRPWIPQGTLHSLKLTASPELRALLNLTPIMAHLTIHELDNSGIAALRSLLRARQHGHLPQAVGEALPQLPRALRDLGRLTWSARAQGRRYISPQANVLLRLNAAQHTPSASRIMLASERNALGQPKAVLDWRIHPNELATLRNLAAHLRTHLQRTYPSGIEWNPSLLDAPPGAPIPNLDDARHAMGGTCMGTDPRSSVVTPDLRVHGMRNLFIASAAVFPDGSPQLPTLPLMALTLRLADHLHRQA